MAPPMRCRRQPPKNQCIIISPKLISSILFIFFAVAAGECKQVAVDTNQRVDCLPGRFPEDKQKKCARVGCIWDPESDQYHPTVPKCYFPADQGYQAVLGDAGKEVTSLRWPKDSALKNPYSEPNLDIRIESKAMGAGLAVRIGNADRFVPPVPLNRDAQIEEDEKLAFKQNARGSNAFAFAVVRESDGTKLWDTSIGGLVFGDKFIQIATFLPTDRIYGFGENLHHQLKHDFSVYKTWSMFARDQPEDAYNPGSMNEYGVHPFYMGLEPSGKAHGVLIFNSNAQEYTTGPAPHLVYRTIGGQLELFFFPGPTPELVIHQYQQLIGRPYLPAYWSFGFQLCRYGYDSLANLKAAVERTRKAGIPFDVQYADIDYMERYKDFTYDKDNFAGFPEYVKELHQMDMKLILIFDPPVQVNYSAYRNGLQMGASFVEWPTLADVQEEVNDMYPESKGTKVMLGAMWPDYHSAFPDWLDPEGNTTEWWVNEFVNFRKEIPFDGIWIDMNEPSVFGTNEQNPWYFNDTDWITKPHIQPLKCPLTPDLEEPPYKTWNVFQYAKSEHDSISLCERTLCMVGRTGRGKYFLYDTHSLYGWSEMRATQLAQREATGGKRGAIISRSTFPSSGQFGGHWLGDNEAKWVDLRLSIIGIQEFNMFGIPQVGADVCGFEKDTNEELCLRWQQLGAFYSYYRNHNNIRRREQDPAQWESVAKATKVANLFRYRHLPYLYSLHFHASLHGGTVVRPLFFEFPHDPNTYTMSFEFMWGPAILVVPVITADVDTVRGYLPSNGTTDCWYSMSEAHQYGEQQPAGYSTFNAPRNTPLPVFIRGGHIIPRQVPDVTTTAARKKPFQLLVGLTSPSTAGVTHATGELYWDDGDTAFDDINAHPFYHFNFMAESTETETEIQIQCAKCINTTGQLEKLPSLDQIEVFGHLAKPDLATVKLNGAPVELDTGASIYDADKHMLRIKRAGMVDMNGLVGQGVDGTIWTLSWQNGEQADNGAVRGGGGNQLHLMLALVLLTSGALCALIQRIII